MKKLAKDVNLRLSAGYLNSDVNYAQMSLDLHVDGTFNKVFNHQVTTIQTP